MPLWERAEVSYMNPWPLALAIIGAQALASSGCAAGMHGWMHGESHHAPGPARTVVAEFQTVALAVTLELPQVAVGEPAPIVVRVRGIPEDTPITGARVDLTIRRTAGLSSVGGDAAAQAVEEVSGGVFRLEQTFATAGVYEIAVRVTTSEAPAGASPLQISVSMEVSERPAPDQQVRMTPLVVVAGLGMALMMALRLALF